MFQSFRFFVSLGLLVTLVSGGRSAHALSVWIPHGPKVQEELGSKAAREIQWWSVTPEEVRSAPCQRVAVMTDTELLEGIWSARPPRSRRLTTVVFGIQLVEQSDYMVQALRDLLENQQVRTGLPGGKQQQWTSSCQSVLCAVREIFGPTVGLKLLYLRLRYGFNGSHYAVFNSTAWTDAELDEVLLALSDFPVTVLPAANRVKNLTHFSRGYTLSIYGDADVVANASISVFDSWNKLDPAYRRSSLVHELGHYLSYLYSWADSATWLGFSGWTPKEGAPDWFRLSKPEAAVSRYGQTHPSEDFAEAVTAYRYSPGWLRERSPEKYRFLKETVFDGLEYTSERACSTEKALSLRGQREATAELDSVLVDASEKDRALSQVLQSCGSDLLESFNSDFYLLPSRLRTSDACISRTLVSSYLQNQALKGQFEYDPWARPALLDRARRGAGASVSETLLQEFRTRASNQLQKSFVQAMGRVSDWANAYYLLQKSQPLERVDFCVKYSKNVYFSMSPALDGVFAPTSERFSFNHREFLEDFAREICLDLHREGLPIVKPSTSELEAAVRKRFLVIPEASR